MKRYLLGRDIEDEDAMKEIRELNKRIAKLQGRFEVVEEELGLTEQVKALKVKIAELEINAGKKQEEFARRDREVTHKVGLEKKRQEVELEQARREATLAVREENLQADRDRFEEQMKFTTARFEKEVEYLHNLAGQILERLPHVNVNKRIAEGVAARNGHGDEGEDED